MAKNNLSLLSHENLKALDDNVTHFYRNGIEIEKGAILSETWIKQNFFQVCKQSEIFTAYPDIYLDIIKPTESNFELFFYQRMVLRAVMRFKEIYITAPRAFSKSFLVILGMLLQCIFMPRTKRFICAPMIKQSAKIGKEKLAEIFNLYPLLRKEIIGGDLTDLPGNYGNDYITLKFRNGSQLDVVGPLDSTRGGRRQGGLLDELRDHEEEPINEIVLPLLNVSRRLPDNTVNEHEPNQQVICVTSAGDKISFAYDKLIDFFEDSIIDPANAFCFGCDYRVPMMHGLIDKTYIRKLKMSPSYDERSFGREYLSRWAGESNESWFNFEKIDKHRKLKNPEKKSTLRRDIKQFYLISADIGRIHDQTVACIFKVTVINDKYYASLVNIKVLGRENNTKTFYQQCIDLKQLINDFKPKEVVIDTNGLGIGLAEEMTRTQTDEMGHIYLPYGFINDDELKKIQPKDAPQILYGIKANTSLNSLIHGNVYSRINSGMVKFLIREQEAKSALLATKVGQKMSIEKRVLRLLPHETTTRLFEEMANLRLKKTGGNDIVLEQINSRYPKDKYSAFAYGLWRIKELEEIHCKKLRRRGNGTTRKLVFFSEG